MTANGSLKHVINTDEMMRAVHYAVTSDAHNQVLAIALSEMFRIHNPRPGDREALQQVANDTAFFVRAASAALSQSVASKDQQVTKAKPQQEEDEPRSRSFPSPRTASLTELEEEDD